MSLARVASLIFFLLFFCCSCREAALTPDEVQTVASNVLSVFASLPKTSAHRGLLSLLLLSSLPVDRAAVIAGVAAATMRGYRSDADLQAEAKAFAALPYPTNVKKPTRGAAVKTAMGAYIANEFTATQSGSDHASLVLPGITRKEAFDQYKESGGKGGLVTWYSLTSALHLRANHHQQYDQFSCSKCKNPDATVSNCCGRICFRF